MRASTVSRASRSRRSWASSRAASAASVAPIASPHDAGSRALLAEIQNGTFAKNWMDEYHGGLKRYNEYKTADSEHLLETTGKELRKLMSWVNDEA
ncbi:ketol-acid reductoisomerase [Streptomyces sp. V4I2]|nr:hypothetical protein [Streptomyces sp. V4I2]MDQ1051379.1 ketol-acid reductoisomerase [Streptomyces sp. V4I2]